MTNARSVLPAIWKSWSSGTKRWISSLKLGLLLLLFFAASDAEAKRGTAVRDGQAVVVHTRPTPVAVHRALPPYGLGKHVYSGRGPSPRDS